MCKPSQMTMVFLIEGLERECAGSQRGQALSRLNTEKPRARKQSAARGQSWKPHTSMLANCKILQCSWNPVLMPVSLLDPYICCQILHYSFCSMFIDVEKWYPLIDGVKHRLYVVCTIQMREIAAEQEAQLLRKVVSIACCQNHNML